MRAAALAEGELSDSSGSAGSHDNQKRVTFASTGSEDAGDVELAVTSKTEGNVQSSATTTARRRTNLT